MEKTYSPRDIEQAWYARWEAAGAFRPAGDGAPFCIMIPPPNVTGTLHMGHAFQYTLMDALVRYRRMQGCRTLWQPGTDHAGIATQMVVERKLEAQGSSRLELGRAAFVEEVWQWKARSGDTIARQLRRIGASVDWSRERFTMDEGMSAAVTEVFVRLFDKGLVYRGKRLVNWDPELHTALSDLEVQSAEEPGSLWHIRYPVYNRDMHLTVATTRPETLLGDTAVAVHPDDQRYAHLVGGEVELPLTGRRIPIIADSYVDPEFGSGCVKITPAHDFNDYAVAERHGLPMINIFTADATLNENAPPAYRSLGRFAARAQVVADLEAAGLVARIDEHRLTIPRGDRSGAVLEPWLTDQWFVRTAPLAGPAIDAVEGGGVRFIPDPWAKTYFEWMRNIQDWCISRQLWWGHRIPAWYDPEGRVLVARSEAEARQRHGLGADVPLRRDDDVLDTWFSSALWPFSTLGWPADSEDLRTFYPTSILVTGFDIIFFWVARMIMMGLEFMNDVPFREVYIHGLIRDQDGQKMSKSKGNVLDPLDLIDGIDLPALIAKRTSGLMQPHMKPRIEAATRRQFPDGIKPYGADALRFTFAALASTGRDIRFDLGRIEGYRAFCNKLWQASRYVRMNCETPGESAPAPEASPGARPLADRWIRSRLARAVADMSGHLDACRFDLAAGSAYDFAWHELCDWYLEMSKLIFNAEGNAQEKASTRRTLAEVLETVLRMLHPIIPFVTEELWQHIGPLACKSGATIMLQPWPEASAVAHDEEAERDMAWIMSFVLAVRRIRADLGIAPTRPLKVQVRDAGSRERGLLAAHGRYLEGLGRLESIETVAGDSPATGSATALLGDMKILVPMAGLIDAAAELERLSREIARLRDDLARSAGKLGNRAFVDKAPPPIVAQERERAAAMRSALASLEAQRERVAAFAAADA
ncbi:MAG TPA: valine--tRNA ligase [Gammaproteobacteria bacterium]|nr:valine--tRNA ligase [Gammaproteobacteria bacterium]